MHKRMLRNDISAIIVYLDTLCKLCTLDKTNFILHQKNCWGPLDPESAQVCPMNKPPFFVMATPIDIRSVGGCLLRHNTMCIDEM